jgi:hypothetical protein
VAVFVFDGAKVRRVFGINKFFFKFFLGEFAGGDGYFF